MKKNTVDMFTRIFKVLQPPPEMTLSQWADKFRRLSAGSSAEPGRWKTAKAPYQKEIMDAITDITIKKVVIMSAAQVGKTDAMVLNPIGYYVHYDPSPIMVIQPTIDMAEKLRITLVKSPIGAIPKQRATVEALGLGKMHKTVEMPDNAATRGMIQQVQHLVKVEEA